MPLFSEIIATYALSAQELHLKCSGPTTDEDKETLNYCHDEITSFIADEGLKGKGAAQQINDIIMEMLSMNFPDVDIRIVVKE